MIEKIKQIYLKTIEIKDRKVYALRSFHDALLVFVIAFILGSFIKAIIMSFTWLALSLIHFLTAKSRGVLGAEKFYLPLDLKTLSKKGYTLIIKPGIHDAKEAQEPKER